MATIKAASESQWQDLATKVKGKQDALVSGTNIKTINGNSVLGGGDITISSAPFPTYNAVRLPAEDTDYVAAFRVDVDDDFSVENGKMYFIKFTEGDTSGKQLELDFYKDNVALNRYTTPYGVFGKNGESSVRTGNGTTSSGRVNLMYISFQGYSQSFSSMFLNYNSSSVQSTGYMVNEIGTYNSGGVPTPTQTGTFANYTPIKISNNYIRQNNSGIEVVASKFNDQAYSAYKIPHNGARVELMSDFTISCSWGGTVNVRVKEYSGDQTQDVTFTYTKTANTDLRIILPKYIFSWSQIEIHLQLVGNSSTATISGNVGVDYIYGGYGG